MTLLTWFANSAAGRALVLATVVLLCWWAFSAHYREVGRQEGLAQGLQAHIDNEAKGREVASAAAEEVAKVEEAAAVDRVVTVEKIHTVYRDRVTTVPVVTGSCVFPVEPGVQAELQLRWAEANGVSP